MKKLLGIVVLGLFLSTSAFAKYGKGEIKLSEGMMEYFLEYIYGGTKNLDPSTGGGTTNKNMKSVPKLFTVNVVELMLL